MVVDGVFDFFFFRIENDCFVGVFVVFFVNLGKECSKFIVVIYCLVIEWMIVILSILNLYIYENLGDVFSNFEGIGFILVVVCGSVWECFIFGG